MYLIYFSHKQPIFLLTYSFKRWKQKLMSKHFNHSDYFLHNNFIGFFLLVLCRLALRDTEMFKPSVEMLR
jgi:hypothetical protein